MQRLILAAIAAMMLAGPVFAADQYANIKTIGVVSTIGTKVWLADVGWSNERGQVSRPTPDWKLDQYVVTWASQVLAARFSVKPVTYDPTAFNCDPMADCIQRAAASAGVDAIVLVHPHSYMPAPVGLIQGMLPDSRGYPPGGVGVLRQLAMLGSVYAYFASYRVTVYDASGKELDHGSADTDGFVGTHAFVRVDTSEWPAPDDIENRLARIEDCALRLVRISLPTALYRANLIDKPERARDREGMVMGEKPIPYFSDPAPAQ
jgi:hypothetical protein